jgi:hypothetical protein
MKKSDVYSWRVAPDLKAALEQEARRERRSLGGLLEWIATEWLMARRRATGSEDEQARLRALAGKAFGRIAGGEPHRSTSVRASVRRRLAARRGR